VKRLVYVLMLLAAAIALVSCAQVKDEDITRPWTEPEPWERNIGIGPFGP